MTSPAVALERVAAAKRAQRAASLRIADASRETTLATTARLNADIEFENAMRDLNQAIEALA